ncbi:MAG: hypothetical protein AB1632_05370 [Nitrospirota bacterium]
MLSVRATNPGDMISGITRIEFKDIIMETGAASLRIMTDVIKNGRARNEDGKR